MGSEDIPSLNVLYKEFFKIFTRRGVIPGGPEAPRGPRKGARIPGIK